MPGSSSAFIGLPHHSTRSASRSSPRTRFSTGRLSRLQLFRDVQASKFARLPDRSYRSKCALLGSRGLYIRAERASLPSHASDMLSARLQAISGTRTFTSQDSQPCRLLPDGADWIVHADRLDGMDPPSVDPYRMLDDYARTTSNKIRLGAWRRARPLATTVRYLPCSSCFASSARIGDRSPGPRAGPRAIPVRSPRGDAGTEIPNPTAFERSRWHGGRYAWDTPYGVLDECCRRPAQTPVQKCEPRFARPGRTLRHSNRSERRCPIQIHR